MDAVARSTAPARTWRGLAAVVVLALAGAHAQAGLFDDEEARKAILELRARIAQGDDLLRQRIGELAQQLTQVSAQNAQLAAQSTQLAAQNTQLAAQFAEQVAVLRRSMLDLNNQIEQTRSDMAKLRGSDEQLQRDLADSQKRQADLAQAIDTRIRLLEPTKISLDGREFNVQPDEKRQYEEALVTLRNGDFEKAAAAFAALLRRYPGSGYADAARYWQANALYGKRDYKEAVLAFRAFVTAAPEHARAGEALLALANSQAEMKDRVAARKTIEELLKSYPASDAARAGKERLASLK